jgi:SulP family sulfate permease
VGVEQGIILAMVLSLLRVVGHSYRPHTAVLVQSDDGIWTLTPVSEARMDVPGLIIYRFGASLFYANAGLFADEIRNLAESSPSVRRIIVDAGAIANVDYTAARIVRELVADLKDRGIKLAFAHVQSDLRPDLERHKLTSLLGPEHIYDTLRSALADYRPF